MSNVVDHQPKLKHYCRVCKKGFGCGRALGGHMRSHGIGGEGNGNIEDEEEEEEDDEEEEDECVGSDWEEKVGGNQSPGGSKRMYALRTKTNRLKNCKPCENCGKEFSSSKSFLKHEKCSSVDDESLLSSKGSDEEDNADEDGGVAPRERYGWSKGKRSRRAKLGNSSTPNCIPSSEDEDLANCLVMLSNAAQRKVMVDQLVTVAETEESCASASKEAEEDRRKPPTGLGSSTMLTTTTTTTTTNRLSNIEQHYKQNGKGISSTTNIKGMFECKACKKVFNSHQALGGHRASHKKVKGCFASKIEDNNMDETLNTEEDVITNEDFSIPTKSTTQSLLSMDHLNHHQQSSSTSYKKKSKVHECSICHRIFSSGQALGGHKRCHWLTSSNSTENSSIINKFQFQDQPSRTTQIQNLNHHINQILPNLSDQPKLDLNLPAPIDDHNVTSTIGSSIIRHEICRPRLSFEMPTDIYLQPWNIQNKDHLSIENNKRNSLSLDDDHQDNIDDRPEDIKKMKLSKLRDIKDINMGGATSSGGATGGGNGGGGGGGSFTWLQMGIGSSTSNP